MKHDLRALVNHLSERSLCGTVLTGADLLEQLWYFYLEENTADPPEIREGFRDVENCWNRFLLEAQTRFLTPFPSNAAGISGRHFWMV